MRERKAFVGAVLILGVSAFLIGSHQLGLAAQTGQSVQSASSAAPRATSTRPATQPASRPAASRPAVEVQWEVIAYYFHRTIRCPSCLHIEATAKQTIQDRFAGEIDVGLLRWEAVDVQKPGKEHFVADYELSTSSLVLVKKVDGRQTAWKNCEKVWDLHQDEPAFAEYVEREVREMLSAQTMTTTQPSTTDGDSEPLPRLVSLGAKGFVSTKQMAPVLEQLKTELAGKARVEFMDILENSKAAEPYAIRVIPTQIVYDRSGKETWRHEGPIAKEEILRKLREAGAR